MVKMMANTEVDICNMALGRIRAKSVGTLTENSIQAEKCRIFYPEARDTVLSLVDWPFNKKDYHYGSERIRSFRVAIFLCVSG